MSSPKTSARVALCQIDTTVGDFSHNIERICAFLKKAAEEKADIAVFPELTLSSYPPLDLLARADFLQAGMEALKTLEGRLQEISGLPRLVVLGGITENPGNQGKAAQNCAFLFEDGKLALSQPKRLLPTYDVFDEARYFEPGRSTQLWDCEWGKLGLSVCEDAWFDDDHNGRKPYVDDPADFLRGSSLVINVSSSPFEMNKRARRKTLIPGFAKKIGAPVVYVNQVGANDEILFDGGSLICSADGQVVFEMPYFREALAVMDFDFKSGGASGVSAISSWGWAAGSGAPWEKMFLTPEKKSGKKPVASLAAEPAKDPVENPSVENSTEEIEILHRALVTGIRDYFRKTGFKKAVLGLSGGIDSAVVACLAAEALGPNNVLGVSIPTQYSSSHSLTDAEALARVVGLEYQVLSLKFIFSAFLMELKGAFGNPAPGAVADVTEENIQARLRAVLLLALANKRGALLLTTGNKSELAVGYCTTYGDMAGALAPLGDVYKTRVYSLARFINSKYHWISESTLTKPPSAELRAGQTDEATLGSYGELDRLLERHLEGLASQEDLVKAGFDAAYVRKIMRLIEASEFKRRQGAPILKVTSKAFGIGRRIPIAKAISL